MASFERTEGDSTDCDLKWFAKRSKWFAQRRINFAKPSRIDFGSCLLNADAHRTCNRMPVEGLSTRPRISFWRVQYTSFISSLWWCRLSGSDRFSPFVAFASPETPLLARLPKAQSKFPKLLVGRRLCCPAAILQRCQIVNSTQCTRKSVSKRIQFYQRFIVQGYSAATNYVTQQNHIYSHCMFSARFRHCKDEIVKLSSCAIAQRLA